MSPDFSRLTLERPRHDVREEDGVTTWIELEQQPVSDRDDSQIRHSISEKSVVVEATHSYLPDGRVLLYSLPVSEREDEEVVRQRAIKLTRFSLDILSRVGYDNYRQLLLLPEVKEDLVAELERKWHG